MRFLSYWTERLLGSSLAVIFTPTNTATLRPPFHCSADGGMRDAMLAARARAGAAAAAAAAAAVANQKLGQAGGVAAAGAAQGSDYVARLARRRWDQVRMLVDFYKAHR